MRYSSFSHQITRRLKALIACFAVMFTQLGHTQEFKWPNGFEYGNWCGLDHPEEPSDAIPAIDEIDDACRVHDSAYAEREPWGDSGADHVLVQKLSAILARGTSWKLNGEGQTQVRGELSERQYLVAATIVSWFTGQQFLTVYSDVLNGKVSSVFKLGTSTARTVVTLPASFSNKVITSFSKEISEATGLPIDDVTVIQDTTDVAVRVVFEIADGSEWLVDEVGDTLESALVTGKAIVVTVGKYTEIEKPVRELEDEVIGLLTDPVKTVEEWPEKVVKILITPIEKIFDLF